jgi:GMP synthase (glutamine-hydrolysing)
MSFQSGKTTTETVLNLSRTARSASLAPSTGDSLLPVLIVLHQETSTPGRVGNVLRALGHRLDVRRPRFGDPLPETLSDHTGAVIFGGPMSANDPDDFNRREIDWIAVPLREQRPLLGICLGAQMLAKQLGGRVAPHPEGRAQIGYYPAGRIMSITGTARDLSFPVARNCWRRAPTSRSKRSNSTTHSVFNFIPR